MLFLELLHFRKTVSGGRFVLMLDERRCSVGPLPWELLYTFPPFGDGGLMGEAKSSFCCPFILDITPQNCLSVSINLNFYWLGRYQY